MLGVASGSSKAVLTALAGNAVLLVIKTIAYLLSGSGAMLAEAVHSGADLCNQALLWLGIRQSSKGPSEAHHFGYGKDRFLWALISAAGIFFLGCGVSVTHGLHALFSHEGGHGAGVIVWLVLIISLVVDGYVLREAIRELDSQRNGRPWFRFLQETDDTSTLAVLFEDGAACLGVIFAMIGIFMSTALHIWWADAAAAITIGVLLGVVALFLGAQNRAYLLDRAISADVQARVLGVIRKEHSVAKVLDVKSRVVSANLFSFNADIEFDGAVLSERVMKRMNVDEAFEKLKGPEDLDRLLDEHARVVVDELGEEVDRIEKKVRDQIPGAKFIQLEVD